MKMRVNFANVIPLLVLLGRLRGVQFIGHVLVDVRDDGMRWNFDALHVVTNNYQTYGSSRLIYRGHDLSTHFYLRVRTESNGTTWLVYPVLLEQLAVVIIEPDEVLQRQVVEVNGSEISTVNPEILSKLNRLMMAERRKRGYTLQK